MLLFRTRNICCEATAAASLELATAGRAFPSLVCRNGALVATNSTQKVDDRGYIGILRHEMLRLVIVKTRA